ncbi:TIR domain-containing protein, partial [Myxococcota bacterium]|nr:TIR domain-containing protein [Myxococcota bacterium]
MTTRVFISYSHDSEAHADWVWSLAERLRRDGLDVRTDQDADPPAEGWPRWMLDNINQAEFVLLVCTAEYRRRFESDSTVPDDVGKGVDFEGFLITGKLYCSKSSRKAFVPVLPEPGEVDAVPEVLSQRQIYPLPSHYLNLYRVLTGQPRRAPSPVGPVRRMAPESVAPMRVPNAEAPAPSAWSARSVGAAAMLALGALGIGAAAGLTGSSLLAVAIVAMVPVTLALGHHDLAKTEIGASTLVGLFGPRAASAAKVVYISAVVAAAAGFSAGRQCRDGAPERRTEIHGSASNAVGGIEDEVRADPAVENGANAPAADGTEARDAAPAVAADAAEEGWAVTNGTETRSRTSAPSVLAGTTEREHSVTEAPISDEVLDGVLSECSRVLSDGIFEAYQDDSSSAVQQAVLHELATLDWGEAQREFSAGLDIQYGLNSLNAKMNQEQFNAWKREYRSTHRTSMNEDKKTSWYQSIVSRDIVNAWTECIDQGSNLAIVTTYFEPNSVNRRRSADQVLVMTFRGGPNVNQVPVQISDVGPNVTVAAACPGLRRTPATISHGGQHRCRVTLRYPQREALVLVRFGEVEKAAYLPAVDPGLPVAGNAPAADGPEALDAAPAVAADAAEEGGGAVTNGTETRPRTAAPSVSAGTTEREHSVTESPILDEVLDGGLSECSRLLSDGIFETYQHDSSSAVQQAVLDQLATLDWGEAQRKFSAGLDIQYGLDSLNARMSQEQFNAWKREYRSTHQA